jgi:hypothetical protein
MQHYTVFDAAGKQIASGTSRECAEAMGVAIEGFRRARGNCMIGDCKKYKIVSEKPPQKSGNYGSRRYYTVYLNKTDEVIAFGNARECAEMMGTSLGSFYSTISRARRGEIAKYSIEVEEFEDEE